MGDSEPSSTTEASNAAGLIPKFLKAAEISEREILHPIPSSIQRLQWHHQTRSTSPCTVHDGVSEFKEFPTPWDMTSEKSALCLSHYLSVPTQLVTE